MNYRRVLGNGKPTLGLEPRFSLQTAIKHLEVETNNLLMSRFNQFRDGLMDHPDRDLNSDCGYLEDTELNITVFKQFFRREAIAKKAVTIWPDETFQILPEIFESPNPRVLTRFEKAWRQLEEEQSFWHYAHRLDVVSGLGRYGVMFMGFDDTTDPSKPLAGIGRDGQPRPERTKKGTKLQYLRVFDEEEALIEETETKLGPRYGFPKFYRLRVIDPASLSVGGRITTSSKDMVVHWSRCLHLADNCLSNELFGLERMRPVYNRIFDLRKIMGGSAEMFWKGAFPGISFEALPERVAAGKIDKVAIKKEFEDYYNGLKRYLSLIGMVAKPLVPQIADPSKHVEEQLQNIAAGLDVPFRVFTGSEIAHLASTQDITTWNKRLARRQRTYINPRLIRPFVWRCIMAGALPPARNLYIDWSDLNALADTDRAEIAMKKSQALLQYVTGGIETIMPPFEYYTLVLGLSTEQAQSVMAMVKKSAKKKLTADVWGKPVPAGNQVGAKGAVKNPASKTGVKQNAV